MQTFPVQRDTKHQSFSTPPRRIELSSVKRILERPKGQGQWVDSGPKSVIDFENVTLGSETEIPDYNYKFF